MSKTSSKIATVLTAIALGKWQQALRHKGARMLEQCKHSIYKHQVLQQEKHSTSDLMLPDVRMQPLQLKAVHNQALVTKTTKQKARATPDGSDLLHHICW